MSSEHNESEHSDLTVELLRRITDACVLAVSGELSLRSTGRVTAAVSKALADTGCVLIDVSGLRLTWPPAVQVFPTVLERRGGWPGARLVLFGADPELARSLTALRVSTTVPVAPDEATAWGLLHRRPRTIARHIDLEQPRSSARRARLFVRGACADWQLDGIRDDAVFVASELVTNAVLHAGTACRLTVRHKPRGLTIAVRDYRPDRMPPLRLVDSPSERHRGLFVVAALSLHWGITPAPDGKIIWANLAPPPRPSPARSPAANVAPPQV